MYNTKINKYHNQNTLFNKLNPISKVILLLLTIITSLISNNYIDIIIVTFYIIIILIISKINIKIYLNSIWNIKVLIIFIIIINLIFKIDTANTILIIYRILAVILISTMLICTTSPQEITYAQEKILKPFNKIINIQELALMITLCLRFIPSIKKQEERITKAISVRGIDFSGSIKNKLSAISILIPPIFTSTIQKSDSIADIMEVRLYNYNNDRTYYRLNNWQYQDTILITSIIVIMILIIIL